MTLILDLSSRVGANNPNWKGGKTQSKGYILIRKDGHHRAWKHGKYVYAHIDAWEREHDACLCLWGNVDHKDGNKQNNHPSNLEAMMAGKHTSRHKRGIQRKDMSGRTCFHCGSMTTQQDSNGRPHWYKSKIEPTAFMCFRCRDSFRDWRKKK